MRRNKTSKSPDLSNKDFNNTLCFILCAAVFGSERVNLIPQTLVDSGIASHSASEELGKTDFAV